MLNHEMVSYCFKKYVTDRFVNQKPKFFLKDILVNHEIWKGGDILSFVVQETLGTATYLERKKLIVEVNALLEEFYKTAKDDDLFVRGINTVDYYNHTQEKPDTGDDTETGFFDIDYASKADAEQFFFISVMLYYIGFIQYVVNANSNKDYLLKLKNMLYDKLMEIIGVSLSVVTKSEQVAEEGIHLESHCVFLMALYRVKYLMSTYPKYKHITRDAYDDYINSTQDYDTVDEGIITMASVKLPNNLAQYFVENYMVLAIEFQVDLLDEFFNVRFF
uniref:Uncharacterized protein n=1 Tax=Myoviridae sp. ctLnO19 TaxID=2825085 RepID=A0A8S5P2H2_9CAUD|nr:MAG TPA: hypothetical protein [Myoviridae sp. ctLnO19]